MKINEIYSIKEDIENITNGDIEDVFLGDIKNSDEPDTKTEKEIFKILQNFFRPPIDSIDPDDRNTSMSQFNRSMALYVLQQLEKLKEKYPNDLIPPHGAAYRGTSLKNKEQATQITRYLMSQKTIPNGHSPLTGQSITGYTPLPFTYKPISPIQSWTTKIETAGFFSSDMEYNDMDGRIPCVIEVKIDDSFIMNPEITNKIGFDENEVVRISKDPIEGVLLIMNSTINMMK